MFALRHSRTGARIRVYVCKFLAAGPCACMSQACVATAGRLAVRRHVEHRWSLTSGLFCHTSSDSIGIFITASRPTSSCAFLKALRFVLQRTIDV